MERRLLLAIAAMIAVMVLSNLIFPPIDRPVPQGGLDTTTVTDVETATDTVPPATPPAGDTGGLPAGARDPETAEVAERLVRPPDTERARTAASGDTVVVRSDLYEYRFDTRGADLVLAWLFEYPNFAPDAEGGPVEIIRPGDGVLGYRVTFGGRDTLPFHDVDFEPSTRELDVSGEDAELTFRTEVRGIGLEVTYTFSPTDYHFDVRGRVTGLGGRGHTILIPLGTGLQTNEANPQEDFGQMALVVRDRGGDISTEGLDSVDEDETRALEGGPFSWGASKSKYFLVALVSSEDGPGFGGVLMTGRPDEHAAAMEVALPVPAGTEGFEFLTYVGPQVFDRLRAIGQDLHNVNPFGWRILQWFIRPFGALVIALLVWMHQTFTLAYGWVLILFGVLTRIVLFPLYQKSMRTQMKQMAIQPEIKRIQEKYKEEPQKLQQEMMKIYKEAGVNPLGGCLPMLVPFPILITLFFVFQNTIEFRGVPFWWIPDLSLKDPLYIVPILMGASMLVLNWIGQRGMETNSQMKMFTYVLPVVFTFMFAQFAAGLNLYYAASNIASLPQQLYLAKERREARARAGPAAAAPAQRKKPDRSAKRRGGGGRNR